MSENRIPVRRSAYRLLGVQSVMALLTALVAWLWQGWPACYSVLLGGVASILPNGFYAFLLLGDTRARSVKQIILRFYLGEIAKLFLSGLLFVVFITLMPVKVPMVIAGFIAATIGFVIAPLFIKETSR